MHGIIRKWILFLCVTLAKSKDCTLQDFLGGDLYSPNFDITGMDNSYADTKQVRVGCNVGFSGFFKLICENGIWKSRGSGCQPRSCGHPGDAPFADFQLVNGTDFVFGSKVVYICHKGYHMVSRRNYRNCLTGGWDGAVPVCEAQQCPAIRVDTSKVKVTGDPEEAAFGNVVIFSCKSNSEVLNGPMEIYCDETGKWSGIGWKDEPPTCKPITCRPPDIKNGRVLGDATEYRENEILNYWCDEQFKVANGIPSKCTKAGQIPDWIPTPLCEQIKCHLQLPPLRGTTYEPASTSAFLPGATVTVTCGSTYWIERTDKTFTEATCKGDGEWNIRPVCQEVICSNQRDPFVSYWGVYYWHQKKLGDTASYTCKRGYKSTNGATRATCTRNGWTPKPLCHETRCERHDIENADIAHNSKWNYNDGEEVRYRCRNSGKEFTITCDEGVWTGIEKCSSDESCLKPNIPNGFTAGPYKNTIYYTCDANYKLPTKGWWGSAKCQGGVWSGLQRCIEKSRCGEPPVIPNGKATEVRQPAEEAQILEISCNKGYSTDVEQLTCQDGKWNLNGESLETLCRLTRPRCSPPPRVENALVLKPYRKEFLSDSVITYRCRENFTMEGEDTIKCISGEWEEKNTTCIQKPCPFPEDIPNGSYRKIFGKEFVVGTMIKYTCNEGYRMVSQHDTRTCSLDGWTNTEPICERATCEIAELHSKLRVTGLPQSGETIESGHTLYFECSDGLKLDGNPQIRCLRSGDWSAPFPTCSETCKILDVPNNVNRDPAFGNDLLKGRNLTFTCKFRGHFIQGYATVQCLDNGQWSHQFPTCGTPVHCGNPPPLDNGDTTEAPKYVYSHDERVEFRCQNYYVMEGEPFKTCVNGEWRGDMKCLKPCTVNKNLLNKHNIRFKYTYNDKLYSEHDDEMEFVCKSGSPVAGNDMRVRCLDGEIRLPTCQ
ncbi:complement factor H-like [Salarias fasciatus]|uniref:complement factor H-like n=1 Tax=Salarias fasciatus TaxID=181472 RepID=UPI00117709F7|nr:complement factor H-like [Salarias fasciatus]